MSETSRILIVPALPPIVLGPARSVRIRQADALARLRRLACVLAALALPALGIAAADTVHRAGVIGAMQAAAPVDPTDGAAAPPGAFVAAPDVSARQVRP